MLHKPIFIICIHRSGSTLLKNILNTNSKVAMATDEMYLSTPFYKTFEDQFRKYNLSKDPEILRLIDQIYRGEFKGTFWKDYKNLGIEKEKIFKEIKNSDKTLKSIISILLNEYKNKKNKYRVGAKYPLHPSRLNKLLEWYPTSQIIFLTRDIRAIIASKLNDKATKRRKEKLGIFSFIIHYFTMFFFIFDYLWFAKIVKKNRELGNCFTIKYEDLGFNTVNELKKLSNFLEIPYEQEMLRSFGKPSSHNGEIKYGFDKKRIDKWERILSSFDKFIIKLFCNKAMKRMGY